MRWGATQTGDSSHIRRATPCGTAVRWSPATESEVEHSLFCGRMAHLTTGCIGSNRRSTALPIVLTTGAQTRTSNRSAWRPRGFLPGHTRRKCARQMSFPPRVHRVFGLQS
jgi:hypothetical protein